MFITIPLVLILVSAIGIFIIIWRKMPYLRKLSVSDTHPSTSLWADFFPEAINSFDGAKLKKYRDMWLAELEKILRRLRVVSLKMDRTSSSLIKRLRNFSEKDANNPPGAIITETEENVLLSEQKREVAQESLENMKKEEQRLIIEIAKNPKNSSFYEALGDLCLKMNNPADAKESFEAAIELSPNNEDLKKKHSQTVENVLK